MVNDSGPLSIESSPFVSCSLLFLLLHGLLANELLELYRDNDPDARHLGLGVTALHTNKTPRNTWDERIAHRIEVAIDHLDQIHEHIHPEDPVRHSISMTQELNNTGPLHLHHLL